MDIKINETGKILLDNEYCRFDLEDGIIIGRFKGEFGDLSAAHKITNYRLEIQQGISYPLLSNIKLVKNSTKEARDFLASKEGCAGAIAVAILIDSAIGRMIGNFFISFSKPLIPAKIFTDDAEAKKWLSQYVKKD